MSAEEKVSGLKSKLAYAYIACRLATFLFANREVLKEIKDAVILGYLPLATEKFLTVVTDAAQNVLNLNLII